MISGLLGFLASKSHPIFPGEKPPPRDRIAPQMALFAPIPRARVRMAMALKPGDFRSMRKA
jgi:hypothetical protein